MTLIAIWFNLINVLCSVLQHSVINIKSTNIIFLNQMHIFVFQGSLKIPKEYSKGQTKYDIQNTAQNTKY